MKFLYYHLEHLDSLRGKTCQPIEELGRLYDIQVKTQQIYYEVEGQVNDNMFRPFYSSAAIIRSSKVTLRGIYKVIECLLL